MDDSFIFELDNDDFITCIPPDIENSPENANDERDDCTEDLSDDEEALGDPIPLQHTLNMKTKLAGQDIASKVKNTLSFMDLQGINLPIFLDALSWGDKACHSDPKIQYARTSLMVSAELPGILECWYNPPRSPNQKKGKRPAGARQTLQEFAKKCVRTCVDREMKTAATLFLSPPENLSQEHLTGLDFKQLKADVIQTCPVFWNILRHAAYSQQQAQRNKHKDPDMVILNIVSQCQYTRSHRRARVTKLWSIYLKACGLSARAFDAVHSLALTMSHKWTANAYGHLSERAMGAARIAVQNSPWTISHDNVNIPLRVFSQRLHNQNHFVSGCAATLWVLPQHAALPLDTNRLFQKFRARNCTEIFPLEEALYGDDEADIRIAKQNAHRVLRILLDSPGFEDYPGRADPILSPPPAVHELSCGPDNIVQQFILRTCALEEASYDGTVKVIAEWLQQLHLHTDEEQIRTSLERIIAWLGDQLTVERLRGLWRYRHEDHNSFDRMDYLIPIFGWFHLVMAFANSLHKQYLGTSAGVGGLRQAFDILKRTGLLSQSTQGTFWHHLDEAIKHISEAHFRASWLVTGNVTSLTDLKVKTPHELLALSEKLICEHASRKALVHMENLPAQQQDQVRKQWTMWNMDVLPYLNLREAIQVGDIGRMEDLLPTLLLRFSGGGNSKYTIEILELLQGLHREWPDDIKNYIREWCWLMNRTGKRDNFLPFDLAQEENIADIKVNYRSLGPGATMEYLGKISPAIPTLRKVQRHMENQFQTVARGAHHGVPDKEQDVATLAAIYSKSELHVDKPGRQIKAVSDKANDYITIGSNNLERLGTVESWFSRRTLERSTREDW